MRLGMISMRPNLGLDVRLERSVCALLLGKDQDEVGLLLGKDEVGGRTRTRGEQNEVGGRTAMARAPDNGAAESSEGSSHGGPDSIRGDMGAEALGNDSAIEVMVRAALKYS